MVDEPVTVVVSLKGWVRALEGPRGRRRRARRSRPAMRCTAPSRAARVDTLLVFGSNGARVYSSPVAQLPGGARRRPADHHADRPRDRHAAGALLRRRTRSRRCCSPTPAASACWRGVGDLVVAQRGGKTLPDASKPARSRCRRASPTRHGAGRLPVAERAPAGVRARRAEAAAERRPRADADRPRREGRAGQRRRVQPMRCRCSAPVARGKAQGGSR